jgi:thiol-disulfide isomerase/thioredoxin
MSRCPKGQLLLFIAFGALLITTTSCSRREPLQEATAAEPSADAPVVRLLRDPAVVAPFSIRDLDGRTVSSESLKGKVVLVNFWATWCPPCRAEIPDLIKLQDKYRDRLVVLGISEDEVGVDAVRTFVAAQKMNYPVAMTTPELRKTFRGVMALPTTFVIDPEGRLVQKHVGMLNAADAELETQVLLKMNVNARIERVEDADRVRLQNAAQAKEIPGVDLTKLTPEKRTAAIKALNADDCKCGCGLTLAECRINDPNCKISLPLAQQVVKKIAAEN